MTPEQKFWALIKDRVPGHVNRIESTLGVGIPDVNFCWKGQETWLENKALDYPYLDDQVGDTCQLDALLKQGQINWHAKRVTAGGRVLVANRGGEVIYLWECRGYNVYRLLYVEEKPWTWKKFELALRGEE